MRTYVARRLALALLTLLGISVLIFALVRVIPGDVTAALFGEDQGFSTISEAERRAFREGMGLNNPLYQQYFEWLRDVVTLRLGESFYRGETVMSMILARGPITVEIAVIATLLSWLVGVPAGILAAVRRGAALDVLVRLYTILQLATPTFWVGILVVIAYLNLLRWQPAPGLVYPWQDFGENIGIVAGPSVVLGLGTSAFVARLARSGMLDVIRQDYVRTARAKGLSEVAVMWTHAFRNAIIPVLTLSSLSFGHLLGGSVAVEIVFGVPGLGRALVTGFQERDYMVVQNLILLYGVIFVITNLIADLVYAWLDPRIRYT